MFCLENPSRVRTSWRPSIEVKTSPPRSIRTVRIMNWVLENTSISTEDMLETVVAETEVKKMSRLFGVKEVLGFDNFRARKPIMEIVMK